MSKKLKPIDGLGPREKAKIRNALRDVWRYSLQHRMVVKRCLMVGDKQGRSRCEGCKKPTAKVFVDHITPCGQIDRGFIERLFIPSKFLQGLCKGCHDPKTKAERGLITNGF